MQENANKVPEAVGKNAGVSGQPYLLSNTHEWVNLHADGMFRFAMLRVRDRDVAEELVQEAMVAALEARGRFDGRCSERTWLVSILKYKIIDHMRKRARDRGYTDTLEKDTATEGMFDGVLHWKKEPGHWPAKKSEAFGSQMEREEFQVVFGKCFRHLPERVAQAFSMKVLDEGETGDVCKVLEVTPTNLWVLLHRARLRLRECLEQNWFLNEGVNGDEAADKGQERGMR
jgi:RNA polymerase sigma-70 factor (TIGR02943 family)